MTIYPETFPTFTDDGVWLPPLPFDFGDGARGWVTLARVCFEHDLELGNPYADGTVGTPDSLGYALAAVLEDGDTLCHACLRDPSSPVHPAGWSDGDGWTVVGWTYSGECGEPEYCGHCGEEWTGLEGDA